MTLQGGSFYFSSQNHLASHEQNSAGSQRTLTSPTSQLRGSRKQGSGERTVALEGHKDRGYARLYHLSHAYISLSLTFVGGEPNVSQCGGSLVLGSHLEQLWQSQQDVLGHRSWVHMVPCAGSPLPFGIAAQGNPASTSAERSFPHFPHRNRLCWDQTGVGRVCGGKYRENYETKKCFALLLLHSQVNPRASLMPKDSRSLNSRNLGALASLLWLLAAP